MPTIAHHFADVNITPSFAVALARPLVQALAIKPPQFHLAADKDKEYGITSIINNRAHVWLYPRRHETAELFFSTIAHELLHCWQFATQTHFNGEEFDEEKCETQAYALEPLATVALAAAVLTQAKSASSKAA